MPQFKDISTLTKKAVVAGDEKIAISGTEFITPSQIGGNTTIATPSSDGLMSASDKQKMDGIAAGANNYTHPDNPNTRHVTDTEKAAWNNKASTAIATQLRNGLMSSSDKQKLDNIEGGGGTPPPVPDYPVYIFKESDTQPGKPTNMTTSDLNNDAGGFWKDYPDAIGSWWGCIGIVDGAKQKGDSGYIKSWSETFPTTGQNGSSVEFRWKDMPKGESPVFTEDQRAKRTPDGWANNPTQLSEGNDRWQTSATITSDGSIAGLWAVPYKISGEDGMDGRSSEIRFRAVEIGVTPTLTAQEKMNRNIPGWTVKQPQVSDQQYLWMIVGYINPDDTMHGDGWTDPRRMSGTNGIKGPIVYPAGEYSASKGYICTKDKTPYVYDPGDKNYYVLNYVPDEPWIGNQQQYKTPHEVVAAGQRWWIKFESFEALYTKIGIIANGLIGSAVFNGDYMISQQGLDASGNKSFDYENFNASNPEQLFRVFWPTAGNIKPERPTSMNIADFALATSSTLEVKWQRCPVQNSNTTVYWYECDGVVDSSTNTIKEWCDPFLYYNTSSDTGVIYAKNNHPLIPPYLDTTYASGDPSGWSSDYGKMLPISSSEKLWFTTGYFEAPNVLYQHPICANGPVKSKPAFTPNVMINYATGEGHFATGKVKIKDDGSVSLNDVVVSGDFYSIGGLVDIEAKHSVTGGFSGPYNIINIGTSILYSEGNADATTTRGGILLPHDTDNVKIEIGKSYIIEFIIGNLDKSLAVNNGLYKVFPSKWVSDSLNQGVIRHGTFSDEALPYKIQFNGIGESVKILFIPTRAIANKNIGDGEIKTYYDGHYILMDQINFKQLDRVPGSGSYLSYRGVYLNE